MRENWGSHAKRYPRSAARETATLREKSRKEVATEDALPESGHSHRHPCPMVGKLTLALRNEYVTYIYHSPPMSSLDFKLIYRRSWVTSCSSGALSNQVYVKL